MRRPRRSVLFVPGDQPRKMERAATVGADAVVLDLEDGVAPDRKEAGRAAVGTALASIDFGRSERVVRVNAGDETTVTEDLLAGRGADAFMLPKVSSPDDLAGFMRLADRVLGAPPPLIALVGETPAGILRLGSFLDGLPVEAWMWGSEDLAGAVGCRPRGQGEAFAGPLALARDLTVLLAAATGAQAIDTVYPFFRDTEGLLREAEEAVAAGFSGKAVIHPDQVEPVNQAFTPTAEQVTRAQAVRAAFQSGTGVAVIEGQMMDLPHLRAAERLLARMPQDPSPQGS